MPRPRSKKYNDEFIDLDFDKTRYDSIIPTYTGKVYFNQQHEDAIVSYVTSVDSVERSRIYSTQIREAFLQIINIWIFKTNAWKYCGDYTQLVNDVECVLCDKLLNYQPSNGKAFSYFTVITKHWLFNFVKNASKQTNTHYELSDSLEIEDAGTDEYLGEYTYDAFIHNMKQYIVNHASILFEQEHEVDIVIAIMDLLDSIDIVQNFNKKAIYIMLRERTRYNTNVLTKTIKKLYTVYKYAYIDFLENGEITITPNTFLYEYLSPKRKYAKYKSNNKYTTTNA